MIGDCRPCLRSGWGNYGWEGLQCARERDWGFRAWMCFRIIMRNLKPQTAQTRNITAPGLNPQTHDEKTHRPQSPEPKTTNSLRPEPRTPNPQEGSAGVVTTGPKSAMGWSATTRRAEPGARLIEIPATLDGTEGNVRAPSCDTSNGPLGAGLLPTVREIGAVGATVKVVVELSTTGSSRYEALRCESSLFVQQHQSVLPRST